MPTPRFVEVPLDDATVVRIAVFEAPSNAAGRPNVVLIHGNSLSAKLFSKQLDKDLSALAQKFNVYAPDLPGHGDSPDGPDAVYSLGGFRDWLAALIPALGLDPQQTIVFGHSLGGHIVIRALPKMALAGAGCVGTPPLDKAMDFSVRFDMNDPNMGVLFKPEKYTREEAEARARGQYAEGTPIEEWAVRDCLRRDPNFARVLSASIPTSEDDELAILASTKVPFLLMHGAKEKLVKSEFLESVVGGMPTAWQHRVVAIEGAGHSPMWERPTEFDAALLAFGADVFSKGSK
ncbi:Alpha/beta hydrolase [Hyaloraphidium curvatum]|nr:Alpha/beta hydrolase [Hyaloraphidium curvatum]